MKADQMILPASCATALREVVDPGLALLPAKMQSGAGRLMVLAICKQESGLRTRVQDGGGPAHGLAQFEKGGGVRGVMTHPASRGLAETLCEQRRVPFTADDVYAELVQDDLLAVGLARLLLYTDSNPLPPLGDEQAGWDYYVRNWRPGKPDRDRWVSSYAEAMAAIEQFNQ